MGRFHRIFSIQLSWGEWVKCLKLEFPNFSLLRPSLKFEKYFNSDAFISLYCLYHLLQFPGVFPTQNMHTSIVNTESRISDTINSNWHDSFLVVLSSRPTNLLSSGGSMPLQPGRQDVGQLHRLLLLLLRDQVRDHDHPRSSLGIRAPIIGPFRAWKHLSLIP